MRDRGLDIDRKIRWLVEVPQCYQQFGEIQCNVLRFSANLCEIVTRQLNYMCEFLEEEGKTQLNKMYVLLPGVYRAVLILNSPITLCIVPTIAYSSLRGWPRCLYRFIIYG